MNDYFTNVGSILAQQIEPTTINPLTYINAVYPSFNDFEVPTIGEITEIIGGLKTSAPGHDGIPASIIKDTLHIIGKPILYIITLSLTSGIVPMELKKAKVVPIYKNGERNLFSNYRPISILPCISKILEKVVYNRYINM